MKFSVNTFEISKPYAKELENKLKVFRSSTRTRKTLFLTMVTTYGTNSATAYTGLVQNEITMNTLFSRR